MITGPEAVTFAQAAEQLSEALGKSVRYVDADPQAVRKAMLGRGVPEWFADDLLALFAFFSTGAAAGVSDAVAKLTGSQGHTFRQSLCVSFQDQRPAGRRPIAAFQTHEEQTLVT